MKPFYLLLISLIQFVNCQYEYCDTKSECDAFRKKGGILADMCCGQGIIVKPTGKVEKLSVCLMTAWDGTSQTDPDGTKNTFSCPKPIVNLIPDFGIWGYAAGKIIGAVVSGMVLLNL